MKNRNKLDGWIILDKPAGITSTHAVNMIKHILRPQKIGHAGTLDPLATGILPLALGEATKALRFLTDSAKEYEFTITWGAATNTDDSEGEVIATSPDRPLESAIREALPEFTGHIQQLPPQFSALKIAGERAYDLAREGRHVDLKPRPVFIETLTLLEAGADSARLHMRCGKGTYVRALARDLGQKLGCLGHVTALRRLKVGPFGETHAFSLDFFEKHRHSADNLRESILEIRRGLDDIPALDLTDQQADRLRQGCEIPHPRAIREAGLKTGDLIRAEQGTALIGFCEIHNLSLKPVRILNL